MKINQYAIYDNKLKAFGAPFFQANNAVALREFENAVKAHDSKFGQHPEDYSLFLIGEFDDHTGVVKPLDHTNLGMAAQFVQDTIRAVK